MAMGNGSALNAYVFGKEPFTQIVLPQEREQLLLGLSFILNVVRQLNDKIHVLEKYTKTSTACKVLTHQL